MPSGDGTGPNGQGSMTGRARGFCAGFNIPGYANPGLGRGFGRGRGAGLRTRNFQAMPTQQPVVLTEKEEKQILEQELETLKQDMKEIESRIKEIK